MKISIVSLLLLASSYLDAQEIHTRIFKAYPIKWDDVSEDYLRDTAKNIVNSRNPKVILDYDVLRIIDNDTAHIYLNQVPQIHEDPESEDLVWIDANNKDGRVCRVFLFYYKETDMYLLRLLYIDTEEGSEYFLNPLKKNIIPFRKESIPQNDKNK